MKIQIKGENKVVDYSSIEINIDTWEKNETWYCIRGGLCNEINDIIRFKNIEDCQNEFDNIIKCLNIYILDPDKEGTIDIKKSHGIKTFKL